MRDIQSQSKREGADAGYRIAHLQCRIEQHFPLLAGLAPHAPGVPRAPHALPPYPPPSERCGSDTVLSARCHRVLTDPGTVTRDKATATGLRDLTWHQARGG